MWLRRALLGLAAAAGLGLASGHAAAQAADAPVKAVQIAEDVWLVQGQAARELEPFDEAFARTDWSRFEQLPLFLAINRINAYNTYLLMEQQGAR